MRQCDICGGDTRLIHKGTRDNPNIDVYECCNCCTKQLSHIGENDYANGFMNGNAVLSDTEIQKRIQQCRPDDMRRAKMIAAFCEGKKVLDFGCGFGGFLQEIQKSASSAVGVEVSADEYKYLMNHGFVVKKDIADYSQQFDVITLFHVFEHLTDPEKWLNIFADVLKPEGCLVLEVPNANDILLSLYDCAKFADFTYWSAHLYLYTLESLTYLIEKNGRFRIKRAGQVQRYPLANHLYWLAKGKPGGQNEWKMFQTEVLNEEYVGILKELKACDTLFFELIRK